MLTQTMDKTIIPADNQTRLNKRRPILYSLLLLFQVLSLISNVVLIPASKDSNTMISLSNAIIIDTIVVLALTAVTMIFLYNFIQRKWLFWLLTILLGISLIINIVVAATNLHNTEFGFYRLLSGITICISIIILAVSFYTAVRDIFGESLNIKDSLLGATNIYLLIGSTFAFLFAFMNIIMPGAIVPNVEISSLHNTCSLLSAYVLAGVDVDSGSMELSVRNALVFESIFAHLYAVFIVGRLLSK